MKLNGNRVWSGGAQRGRDVVSCALSNPERMKALWLGFLALLTPGVRMVLGLLAAFYLAAVAGAAAQLFDLYRWLAASGPDFWHGQIWRGVSYAFLASGIGELLMAGAVIVMVGGVLERAWSRGRLWLYCVVCAAGGGLAKVLLWAAAPQPSSGPAPVVFGLLAGWAFVCGQERVSFFNVCPMKVWQMVGLAAGVGLLGLLWSAGLTAAVVVAAGGLTGWLYLWLREKRLMTRPEKAVKSERMRRLEL